jgi:hypothetical protein
MKKIIRLTESDLTRLIKRMVNEEKEDNNVKKLLSVLVNNGLVDEENMNVYDDNIEVYSINGYDFPYFEENFIILYPIEINEGVVYVEREDYGESIDDEEYDEVISHITFNWGESLGLEFID